MKESIKTGKILLTATIGADIFLYVCFFVGFIFGLGSFWIAFDMLAITFKYGLTLCIVSILLKLAVIVLNFSKDTIIKRELFSTALFSMLALLIIGAMISFIISGKL